MVGDAEQWQLSYARAGAVMAYLSSPEVGIEVERMRLVGCADEGGAMVDATPENAVTGDYPLARLLYVYVNKHPNNEVSPLIGECMKMVLAKTGQLVVVKDGYIPVSYAVAKKTLAEVGIDIDS